MNWMGRAVVSLVALGSGAALAQGDETTVVVSQPGTPTLQEKPFTVTLQGGVEGYSGNLADRIQPGATYGVSLGWDPLTFLGGEIGYTGAINELRDRVTAGRNPNSGPDLLRNGGYAIVKPGWTFPLQGSTTTSIKPYVLGGIGADQYSPQGRTSAYGFNNETVANVPFGAGIQARMGSFLADARFNYAYEFGKEFASADPNPLRYQGQLRIGAAF